MNTRPSASVGFRILAATALCATAVTACSSSSKTTTAGGSPGSSASSAASSVAPADIATMLSYTGGTAGVATGTPVTLGFINNEGGTSSFPEYTSGLTAAVKLLNNQLGGLNGHPIKLVPCYVASSDEEGQACAQKFLADKSIVGVIQGAVETGNASYHSTLNGAIPVLGVNPTDITDATAKNAYFVEGGQFAAPAIINFISQNLKAKSVALLSAAGLPPAVQIAQEMSDGLKSTGVKVTQSTYSPTGTDYLAPVEASGAAKANVVLPLIVSPQQCIAFDNAVKQAAITTPVVTLSACLGPAVQSALKDYPQWTYVDYTVNPDATDPDAAVNAQVAAYKSWLPSITGPNSRPGIAVQCLQAILTLAKVVGKDTTVTRASLGTKLAAFTGPVFLGAPQVKFNANPALPAIGATSVRFYNYTGNGSWKDQTDGKWIEAPAGP